MKFSMFHMNEYTIVLFYEVSATLLAETKYFFESR